MRLFKLDGKDNLVDDKALLYTSVQIYNDSIHSITGYKPNDLLHNKVDHHYGIMKLMRIEKIVMTIQKEN